MNIAVQPSNTTVIFELIVISSLYTYYNLNLPELFGQVVKCVAWH